MAAGGARQKRPSVYLEGNRYEEVDPEWLLPLAFADLESRDSIVRRNEWIDDERIEFARSATRRRISRQRSLEVIRNAGICFERTLDRSEFEDGRVLFAGKDESGTELEVIGVVKQGEALLVIHAMPLRERYFGEYLEAIGWQR